MTATIVTLTTHIDGTISMFVADESREAEEDFVCFMGSDEMRTLTGAETKARDKFIADINATLAKPRGAPVPVPPTFLQQIRKDPILVSIGFALGLTVAAGALHALSLIV